MPARAHAHDTALGRLLHGTTSCDTAGGHDHDTARHARAYARLCAQLG